MRGGILWKVTLLQSTAYGAICHAAYNSRFLNYRGSMSTFAILEWKNYDSVVHVHLFMKQEIFVNLKNSAQSFSIDTPGKTTRESNPYFSIGGVYREWPQSERQENQKKTIPKTTKIQPNFNNSSLLTTELKCVNLQ